jgi:hypothetical protein
MRGSSQENGTDLALREVWILHDSADLVVPFLANRGMFAKLPPGTSKYCLMASGGFSISLPQTSNANSVLAILNSRLLFWYLQRISNRFRGGWITCTKQYVGELPIHPCVLADDADRNIGKRLSDLGDRIIALNEDRTKAKSPQQKTLLERQLSSTDRQIDQLVYELYGLTGEEIAIVEGAAGGVEAAEVEPATEA